MNNNSAINIIVDRAECVRTGMDVHRSPSLKRHGNRLADECRRHPCTRWMYLVCVMPLNRGLRARNKKYSSCVRGCTGDGWRVAVLEFARVQHVPLLALSRAPLGRQTPAKNLRNCIQSVGRGLISSAV